MNWARARCKVLGLPTVMFFPTDRSGVPAAVKVCHACPIEEACLDYALRAGIDHGIWGGKSENERRRIRRRAAA